MSGFISDKVSNITDKMKDGVNDLIRQTKARMVAETFLKEGFLLALDCKSLSEAKRRFPDAVKLLQVRMDKLKDEEL